VNEVGRACGTRGRGEKSVKVLVGKPEGPLGRPRHTWEDGIRMDLGETGLGGGRCVCVWIRLAQDRDQWQAVVSAVMNLRALVPQS
jgi:hypothetical protein